MTCYKPIILFFPEFFRRTVREKDGCSALANQQTYVELYMQLNLKAEKSLNT